MVNTLQFSPSIIFDSENRNPALEPFLEYAKKQFGSLVENSPDIIYIIDLKKRKVIYFNKEYIFDYHKKDLERSEGWIELVHPEDIKKVKAHWNKFLKTGITADQVEYRLKRKSEDYEWVINRHTIIERDSENNPVLILLNITIITEKKKAEQALKESEARLIALIDNTNDIIWSVDKDLHFTALNSSFRNQFRNEFRKEVKIGDNLLEILPQRISGEWLKNHKRALGGESFTTEFALTSKKRNYSYEISYNPIYSIEGYISGVSVFGRDITSRKLAETDIIRTNFELDSFVYRASHDLRAPLRSVLGLINIVKTEENTLQRNHYLNLVDKSINKLDTFISDLTNFSRNSRLEIRVEKIDFKSIIEECVENLKYMDSAKQIDIRSEIHDQVEFYSDSGRISIILHNLLSNSIKYRNPKAATPFVNIKVATTKNHCTIILEDNGRGIREEYLDKIFNMFFRASDDSYGSGLGLYITKQVIEKLKGEISVNSSIGSGSVFEIKLPHLQNPKVSNSKSG